MLRMFLGTVLVALAATHALAQDATRAFPSDSKFGRMTHVQGTVVNLDGNAIQLAPGAVIRSTDNLSIVPSVLPPNAPVRVRTDIGGQVNQVWVLTEAEAIEARRNRPR